MGTLIPSETTAVLTDLLGQARIAISRDPAAAEDWLSRFEQILRQGPVARTGGLAPWQAARVQRHVEAHIAERLHIAELAAIARLGEKHFARAFKATMGTSPHAYVVQRRIHRARALILETRLPLSQVALEAGLADQAHLSRLFRRFLGATPSACRREGWTPPVTPADEAPPTAVGPPAPVPGRGPRRPGRGRAEDGDAPPRRAARKQSVRPRRRRLGRAPRARVLLSDKPRRCRAPARY